jgi:DnaJ-domain-containing protein 1
MSSDEIAVVLICLVGGYWAVSAWLGRKQHSRDAPAYSAPPPATPSSRFGISTTWASTLGVTETATREQIIAAYKQLISEYHPDKVARMGSEIRELAERKSKEINAAYDYAMKQRR